MKHDAVLELLKQKNAEMESRFGVKSLQLFGSVARDEARSSSDVDLLVEFNRPVGYFGLFALQNYLEDLLGCPVDLGTPDSLKPYIRERVMRELVNVSQRLQDRIQDILEAISEIQSFTEGMDYETFKDDDKSIRAVEMNFIIIGEAATQIPDEIEEKYPDIPWSLMRAMRNRIVHVYFNVDEKLMWDTVQNDLPPLISELEKLSKL